MEPRIEAVARALAEWRYEHGANPMGMSKYEWAEKFWPEFVIEVEIVLHAATGNGPNSC